jgi:hypothetical protein
MRMEHLLVSPEIHTLDLTAFEADAVEQLRKDQERAAHDARNSIHAGIAPIRIVGDAELRQQVLEAQAYARETTRDTYLNSHLNRDDNPDVYDRLAALLEQTSPDKMSPIEWQVGTTGADGKHDLETSGRNLVERTIDSLRGEAPATDDTDKTEQLDDSSESEGAGDDADNSDEQRDDETENDNADETENSDETDDTEQTDDLDDNEADKGDSEEEIVVPEALQTTLNEARDKLAALSIKRRQMIRAGGKKARKLEEEYKTAQNEYETAVKAVKRYKVEAWRAAGKEGDELRADLIHSLLDEHQEFSKAERAILDADNSARGRFARWWAKGHRLLTANIVVGVGLGFGLKAAVAGVTGAAVGVAAPAALAAAGAVRTTKAAFAATVGNRADSYRHFDARYNEDHEYLSDVAHDDLDASADHDSLINTAHNALKNTISGRVEIDRSTNRRRVRNAVLIGGAAGLAGVGLEALAEHTHLLGGHGGHHATQKPSGGNGTQPPAGGGHPPAGGGQPTTPETPAPKPGEVDGFQTNVEVSHGEGYQQALTELASQKDIHLSGAQSWALYEHLNDKFNGNFFTNNPSFHMDNPGEWGISHAGASHWNPAVVEEMNNWLAQNHETAATVSKVTKKVGKAAVANRYRLAA